MEVPESWKSLWDQAVEGTKAWSEGLQAEASFLSSRLKEFWDDPEKAISIPEEQGAILPELGLVAQEALENIKGTRSREAWEKLKEGDPEAMASYAMDFMGETGGILRKAAVKKLATRVKGIVSLAKGMTNPHETLDITEAAQSTLKNVVPAMRKIGQEWWDPIGDVKWHFFKKDPEVRGDIASEGNLEVRFNPYKAGESTVTHEVVAHGGQYAPRLGIRKAQVEYKGELVPATDVLEYMREVSRAWRRKPDYQEKWYNADPTEMHARAVAIAVAKGVDPEEAFLDKLPKVVRSFETSHPEVPQHYLPPRLQEVWRKAEERDILKFIEEDNDLPLLIQPEGAPKGFGKKPVRAEERGGLVPWNLGTTDLPNWDVLMNRSNEFMRGRVGWMSPDTFLKRVASDTGQGGGRMEAFLDDELIKKYTREMLEGAKFPMPGLEYSKYGSSHEGRHRAMAAKAAGEKKIPVLVMKERRLKEKH